MEQARISSSQGAQALHTTRNRQGSDTAGATASPGSFLALICAQDEVLALGDIFEDAANSAANVGGMALDVTVDSLDTSAVAAWQGLVTPDAAGVPQTIALGAAHVPQTTVQDAASVPQKIALGAAHVPQTAVQDAASMPQTVALGAALVPQATVQDAASVPQTIALGAAHVPQTAVQGSVASASSGTASGWGGTLVGGDGFRQGLVAETALLDGAADLKEVVLQGSFAGYGRILSRTQSTLAQRGVNAGNAVQADAATGRPSLGAASQHAAMTLPSLVNGLQCGSEHAAAIATQTPSVHFERNGGLVSATLAPEFLSADGGGLAALSASARGGETQTGGRPAEGQSGGTSWSDGAAGAGPLEAGGVDGTSMFADPTQVGAEEYVTDQVAYWVNQKTQNAQLTLDRDGQPVEVSVSLSGNEAHVTFRSDQAETRDLLDRSIAQLSDLLRSEGLVLSGMSVGTSARDGAGASDAGQPRNREGTRQAQVTSAAPARGAAEPKVGVSTGRTVDVFV